MDWTERENHCTADRPLHGVFSQVTARLIKVKIMRKIQPSLKPKPRSSVLPDNHNNKLKNSKLSWSLSLRNDGYWLFQPRAKTWRGSQLRSHCVSFCILQIRWKYCFAIRNASFRHLLEHTRKLGIKLDP